VIASARSTTAKAKTLIHDNKKKLANEKKNMEELEATKSWVQQELDVHTSKLEALQAQLAMKKLLSDDELRVQALAEVEKACQRDIQYFKDQIKSRAEQELLFVFFLFCNTPSY